MDEMNPVSIYNIECFPERSPAQGFLLNAGDNILHICDPRVKKITNYELAHRKVIRSNHSLRGAHMVNHMSFAPAGYYIQTSGQDHCVYIHDWRKLDASKYVHVFQHNYVVASNEGICAEWMGSGMIATACDTTVSIWDIRGSKKQVCANVLESEYGSVCTLDVNKDISEIVAATNTGWIVRIKGGGVG